MNRILRGGVIFGLVLASLPLAPGLGQSQQALSVYEDWSGTRIRGDRWRGGELSSGQEVVRDLQSVAGYGNYLTMSLRREGETDRNTGSRTSSTFLNIANPAEIVQIEAFMGVLDVLVARCQANTTPSEARLLIGMTAFNDGSSTGAGDRTGDYNARVQAVRRSNSTDAPGILRLEGIVTRCEDAACSTEKQIGALQDLGVRPPTGVAFSMRLIWEAQNNRFLAGANANGNVALPYPTVSDALPPGQPSAGIEIRNSTANCIAGATEADLDAGVGPVQIATAPPVVVPPVVVPPVVVPPVVVPPVMVPPVVVPPVVVPPADNTPFIFPAQPPYSPGDPSARYTSLGTDPATGGSFYKAQAEYSNPLPGSHLYAGMLPDGLRLWVPKDAQPAAIRRALKTGKL